MFILLLTLIAVATCKFFNLFSIPTIINLKLNFELVNIKK